jgi:hypothetical protein
VEKVFRNEIEINFILERDFLNLGTNFPLCFSSFYSSVPHTREGVQGSDELWQHNVDTGSVRRLVADGARQIVVQTARLGQGSHNKGARPMG